MGDQGAGDGDGVPVHWRESSPAYLALALGIGNAVCGVALALLAVTWLGSGSGRATGLAVIAVVAAWGFAAVLVVYGGILGWIGWKGLQTGWLRGPAIAAGFGCGMALTLAVVLATAGREEPALLGYEGLIPGIVGALVGWQWSVGLRQRHGDGAGDDRGRSLAIERPGLAGLVGGAVGVVVGSVVMLPAPPVGGAIVAVSVIGAVVVPTWYWLVRPAYRWASGR